MQLNMVIDDKLIKQARRLANMQSDQEIIEAALRAWIQLWHQPPKNPAKALLESDFIGCGKADTMLSVNYKQEFARIIDEKYHHN